jgi:ankyrin repeat protein
MNIRSKFLAASSLLVAIAIVLLANLLSSSRGRELRRATFFGNADKVRSVLTIDSSLCNEANERGRDPHFVGFDLIKALESYFPTREQQFGQLDGLGFTALHFAAFKGDDLTGAALLEAGADPNSTAAGGLTPLQIAALRGNARMLSLLLRAKADVDKKTTYGFAALHFAVLSGRVDDAEALLKSGANPSIRDNFGFTPVALANAIENRQMVNRLSELTPVESINAR